MFDVSRAASATLLAASFLVGTAAGCSRVPPIDFSPVTVPTSVVVNNARGAYHPRTVRDPATLARLVDIMDRYRAGWSIPTQSGFGSAERPACAYGIGFYRKQRWLTGVSIETDGTTVARSQFGSAIAYKSNTRMGNDMLAVLRLPQESSPHLTASDASLVRR